MMTLNRPLDDSPHATDPAVAAILTAETLIDRFRELAPRLSALSPETVTAAIGEAQRIYPAIWAELDLARGQLRQRGIEVATYDELRARQPAALLGVTAVDTADKHVEAAVFVMAGVVGAYVASIGAKTGHSNRAGIIDAVDAAAAFRDVLVDVPWNELHAQNVGVANNLRAANTRHRIRTAVIGVVLAAVAVGFVVLIAKAMNPPAPDVSTEDPVAVANRQIDALRQRLAAKPCEAPAAELLVKKLRIQGRIREARSFGSDFLARCGDNEYIRSRVNGAKVAP
ncbi:MAG: hypothetical protein AB7O24_09685 [Kofleriaceae bacterium]